MKILESTDERLVIGTETYVIDSQKLTNLQLLVNVFLTICFLPIWMNLDRFTQRDWAIASWIFYFIISSILVSVFYSGRKEEYDLFSLIFYSIPIMGVGTLAIVIGGLSQIYQSECLTFDKNKKVLIIKKFKFLFWNRSIQYLLSDLIEARLSKKFVSTGATTGTNIDIVEIARKRRSDGKVVIFDVASGHDANFLVGKINTFLQA
jgi:hypothetical protein